MLTQQINHAYVALLAAQFQAFCRSLHSEAASAVAKGASDQALQYLIEGVLTEGRQLDRGNATKENLTRDFGRFQFKLWKAVEATDKRTSSRITKLERITDWRNAIAHGDIHLKDGKLEPPSVQLRHCTIWRQALDALATSMDAVVADQVENLGQQRPW